MTVSTLLVQESAHHIYASCRRWQITPSLPHRLTGLKTLPKITTRLDVHRLQRPRTPDLDSPKKMKQKHGQRAGNLTETRMSCSSSESVA
jgi:hypothetical protein